MPAHENQNEKAAAYAAEHGLIPLCGSDYHQPEDVADTGLIFDPPVTDSADPDPEVVGGTVSAFSGHRVIFTPEMKKRLTNRRARLYNIGRDT